jgi:hypothetical protein
MQIYLDAKDLINIFEKSNPCSSDQFDIILRQGDHQLVYSLLNIIEISEPLLHANAKTNVMALLNRIEETPHIYIHSSIIPRLELMSAVEAYVNGEEYNRIDPYVQRFGHMLDLDPQLTTKDYLNYSLAEIIWEIYCLRELRGLDCYAKKFKQIVTGDRSLSKKPSLKNFFPTIIESQLRSHQVSIPNIDIKSFSSWIYSDPARCPSLRLGYEVFHKMTKNVDDEPIPSDMEDFCHIDCLPYVDFLTIDKRMCGYVNQACKTMRINYAEKLCNNSKEIVDKLME